MVEGLVKLYVDVVYCVEGICVIVRNDKCLGKVGFVSGGGFGYELVYVGYVGCGMLFVVVCGDVFIFLIFD